MAAVAVIRLEGVLAQTGDLPFMETEARVSGIRLAAAMLATWHVVIVHTYPDNDKARHWLRTRATGVAREVTAILHEDNRAAMGYGHPDVWVTSDPEDAARALAEGIPSLLYTDPVYTRGEMRPDAPRVVSPWSTVVAELEQQRVLLAGDGRMGNTTED